MSELILASGSPRRRELLKLITEDFTVVPAGCEERFDGTLPPADAVKALAKQKAEYVSVKYPDKTVIGADTTVFCGNALLDVSRRRLRLNFIPFRKMK